MKFASCLLLVLFLAANAFATGGPRPLPASFVHTSCRVKLVDFNAFRVFDESSITRLANKGYFPEVMSRDNYQSMVTAGRVQRGDLILRMEDGHIEDGSCRLSADFVRVISVAPYITRGSVGLSNWRSGNCNDAVDRIIAQLMNCVAVPSDRP